MSTRSLRMAWPFDDLNDRDLYFYLEPIERLHPHGRVTVRGHGTMLMLGGYSYLGLVGHPKINRAAHHAIRQYGTGTQGVRLLAGTLELHRELEARIAAFQQTEAAVTFSSGYLANLATIACLVGRGDVVICDKLDHASILDGCRLSRARMLRFRHDDLDDLERCLERASGARRTLVVVDAVFSMDGDLADVPGISRRCRAHGAWLMVDEAHALGVLGRTGHGIEEHFGLGAGEVDIKMGTLSKAIPSVGGYVAGTRELCRFLSHESRAFVYSASLPAPAAAAALAALEVIEQEPERVARLQRNIAHFGAALAAAGWPVAAPASAIFPLVCGDNYNAWRMARECQRRGLYVQAVPHPVVPLGTARLRAVVTAAHRRADLDRCVAVLREAAAASGLQRTAPIELRRLLAPDLP